MTPRRHPSNNAVLAAPAGWEADVYGECADLPITQAGGTMFSYWRLSLPERLALIFGGSVRLGIFGDHHPPVSLDTLS